jgi:CRP-like cAMP-binding protein
MRVERTIFGEHLSSKNLVALMSIAEFVELEAGEYLFREGEENHNVYVLLDGQLDLTMTVPGRGAQRILSLGTGELVAWSAVLGSGIMTCSAICMQSAQLIAINSKAIESMLQVDHEFGFEFMKMTASALAKRLTATRLQLLDLFAPNHGKR